MIPGFRRPTVAVLALALASLLASPATAAESFDQKALESMLERHRIAMDIPGLSAAIAYRGDIVFAHGTGLADVAHGAPATPHTVYNIGSISKANAVLAIMQLVQRGDVSLDDPIQTWVPSFPRRQPEITLRHILTHTSGIRHYRVDDFGGPTFRENKERFATIQDALEIFRDDELLFPPGEAWSYSSYATNILQAVVETVTELGFEELMRTSVWLPAGMTSSSFDIPERIVPGRARSYRRDEETRELQHEPYGDITYKFAGGGMLSTVVDQVRLGAALNAGMLLDAATTKQMYTAIPAPQVYAADPSDPPDPLDFEQGLIWRRELDPLGRPFMQHGGAVIGFRSFLLNYTEQDLVVAVMVNTAANAKQIATDLALAALARLGEQPAH